MSFGVLFKELGAAMITLSIDLLKAITRRHYVKNNKILLLTDLPIEVLAHIFSFLTGKDLSIISRVCKRFYDVTQIDYLWMHCCCTEFGFSPSIPQNLTYKEIYIKVLYKYGRLIGLWQPQVSCYGGLLEIRFCEGKLVGQEIQAPMFYQFLKPVCRRTLFEIKLRPGSGETEVVCKCSKNYHLGEVRFLRGGKFIFRCPVVDQNQGSLDVIIPWLNYGDTRDFPELLHAKVYIISQYRSTFQFWPLKFPRYEPKAPVQPGLFKGTYGAHGVELVMLTYDDHNVQAIKISGDPNVPCNKVTFQADLRYPMRLSVEDQQSLAALEALEATEPLASGPQHFCLPPHVLGADVPLPNTAIARYFGEGQIAGENFSNPSFTRGHWVVFSPDFFGFLWLDLSSLSLYHRVAL